LEQIRCHQDKVDPESLLLISKWFSHHQLGWPLPSKSTELVVSPKDEWERPVVFVCGICGKQMCEGHGGTF
jgi:hypothetical protein